MTDKGADPIEDKDNPELTQADFARAVPFGQMFPRHLENWRMQLEDANINPTPHYSTSDAVKGTKLTRKL